MDLALAGRVILVTGGASGIGAAIVRCCAAEGAVPVILDRDEPAMRALQAELGQKDCRSEGICVDLHDCAATCRAAEEFGQKLGRIDGLVNNAGANDGVGLEHGSPKRFAVL